MTGLNLGCGSRTRDRCINSDWLRPIRLKAPSVGRCVVSLVVGGERLASYEALAGDLLVHDLRKGIPTPDTSVYAVYHSQVADGSKYKPGSLYVECVR